MRINETTFLAYARKAPFGGRLTQQQVDGLKLIVSEWNAQMPKADHRWLAYILATVFHETGGRMVSVREGFAKSDAAARKAVAGRKYAKVDPRTGAVYYGRGHVQLTWADNYIRLGKLIGQDLFRDPDLMLNDFVSLDVLFEGMIRGKSLRGDFTGHSLEDYFNSEVDDPVGARKIVNGTDKAKLIAGYYRNFLDALLAAAKDAPQPADVKQEDAKPDGPDLRTDKTVLSALTGMLGAGGVGALGAINNPWALGAAVLVGVCIIMFLTGRLEIKKEAGA